MTTPSKFSFDSIKEFVSSFTGANPAWEDEPYADLIHDVEDEISVMETITDSADVIIAEPAEYKGLNHARGEVATANMVRDQEAFRLRTIHESADIAWQIISEAIVQGVGPNRMKTANPRAGDYKAEQIPEGIHDVIDGMIHTLRDELIDALYNYSEAGNEADVAEWILRREEEDEDHIQLAVNHICGVDNYDDTVYGEHDLHPVDFEEGWSDYECLNEITDLQCLETNEEGVK